jgi:hypothetical protein
VKEDRGTDHRSIRFQKKRPIPILRKIPRIERTAFKITIGWNTVLLSQPLCDVISHRLEDRIFRFQILGPAGLIEFFDA